MPPTTLPDFEDPEWNDRRVQLQEEFGAVAEKLLDHMASSSGCRGKFEFAAADGRTIFVTLEAGRRPKAN